MATKGKTAPSGGTKATETRTAATRTADLAKREEQALEAATAPPPAELRTADGGRGAGPKSALKGGLGSEAQAGADTTKKLRYSVQIHTDEKGLEVFEPIDAETGDEAAKIALEKKNFRGASVRGVTPYSDPDPNSLGGERDAAIMVSNANNNGHLINTLGTEANAEATRELAKADIKELGE
jgi:hypothetical protein